MREGERERERESQLKMKELEIELCIQLRLKELEKTKEPRIPVESTSAAFGVSKQIKFVPPFQEKKVDKYFRKLPPVLSGQEMFESYCCKAF